MKKQQPHNNKKTKSIFRLLLYIKPFSYILIPAIILALIVSIMNVAPVVIIDQLSSLLGSHTQNSENLENKTRENDVIDLRKYLNSFVDISDDLKYFIAIIIIGIIVGIVKFLSVYISSFLLDYLGRKVVFQVKRDIFENVIHLPLSYFEKDRSGKILSIINNDVLVIQDFSGQVIMTFLKEVMSILLIISYMFILNPVLMIALVVIGPFAVTTTLIVGKLIRKKEKGIREKLSDITNIIFETLNNILVVKSYAMEEKEINNFTKESKDYLSQEKRLILAKTINSPFLELIGFLAVIGILAVGGYQIFIGGLVLADLVTFAASLALISSPIQNVSRGFVYLKQASASTERIFEMIDKEREETNNEIKPELIISKGSIKIENVNFSYNENSENTLININLTIKEKQTIALTGISGSGKSTLIKLIPALIKPQSGKVFIDEMNIDDYSLKSIRKQISIVTQDILLFHGTVFDSIAYGKTDATLDEVIEASKIANAYEFIVKLPNKFDTQIGEKGVKLSGGQRQRIALARALIRKPKILILDEATSSLDSESEKAIQEAFQKINHNQTTIIIAHRLSTIINADTIYIIDKGTIVESGTHEELIKKNGIYRKLY